MEAHDGNAIGGELAIERGRAGYVKYRHDFAKLILQLASPKWGFE